MLKELMQVTHDCELLNPEANMTDLSVRSNCGDITFVNLDTVNTAYVNGYPLGPALVAGQPGASISFGENFNELCTTNFIVKCAKPTGQLGLWVWRKHYVGSIKRDL